MKKLKYIVRRLVVEYKGMYKPDAKTLMRTSAKVTGTAVAAALVLKAVDLGFGAVLALVL